MEQVIAVQHSPLTKLIALGIEGDIFALRSAALIAYNSDLREVGEPTVDEWYRLEASCKARLLNFHPAFTSLNDTDKTQVRVLLCRC